jgi:hypothetical protein
MKRSSYWRERCEASKAVLLLYKTFEKDIPNRVETIILPQLELLDDDSWQFRAQSMFLYMVQINYSRQSFH